MPLPSQLALAASAALYPVQLRVLCGRSPSPQHLSKALKALSTIHSSLVTALAIYVLKQPQWRNPPSNPPFDVTTSSKIKVAGANGYPDDTHNPLISARSEFANAITAIEAGYLLSDTVALLREARAHGGMKALDKTLLTHHVGIGTALLVLHYYIARGRETGIYIIVMFLLMNSSTPILNLRWYLRTYARKNRRAILAADVAFVVAFFYARVWFVWKILKEYGRYHDMDAWETYWKTLRLPCKLGTGALWAANLGWWLVLVVNTSAQSKRFTFGGQ
ncbi:hypothetical protein MMC21_006667 [Puttea exsequens]|nr:hypothetical protein [Puttea exsequens]